mmetsp:Transcript_25012/g.28718  ORF Transcript_25012/g.28718 Transcript_25012/m.28718 type:complete len:518 (+) Transcript_25012:452-2005(+)
MRLHDTLVYSNEIYHKLKTNPVPTRLIGPLKKFMTGLIMDCLEYEFVMRKIRYLNKSFIVFTQENCHYSCHMIRKAYLKTSLREIYDGSKRMPIVNHPYYTNCTKLTIMYQQCKIKDSLCKPCEFDEMFFADIFTHKRLFPLLKELKIVVSHSQVTTFSVDALSQHYTSLVCSENVPLLEKLTIYDTRLCVDWKPLQLLSPENFPSLIYLELPNNCYYDFDPSPDHAFLIFPGMHLKYLISVDNSHEYYDAIRSRFYNKFSSSENPSSEINNRLTLIGCEKIQVDVPIHEGTYTNLFPSLEVIDQTNIAEHDRFTYLRNLPRWDFKNTKINNLAFNATRNVDQILKICDVEVIEKSAENRRVEDFRKYEFRTDFVDPLIEFRVPYNLMTDHCLYILTHSKSFENLRVVDMRGNPISSLLSLKVNYYQFKAPNLEELYVDTTVSSKETSYNISFFFTGLVPVLTRLKVLWIEAKVTPLFVQKEADEDVIPKLAYRTLFLRNVHFMDGLGQEIIDNLVL